MQQKMSAYLQIGLAMALVGSDVVVAKMIASSIPIFILAALRLALASFVFLILVLRIEGHLPRLVKRDIGLIFLQAFLGNFVYTICLLYGVQFTTATAAGIIVGVTPAVISLLSFLLFREGLSGYKLSGIILVIVGMIVLNTSGVQLDQAGRNPVLGNLLISGTVLCEAAWTLCSKALSPKTSPLSTAALTCFFGFLLFLPGSLFQSIHFSLTMLSVVDWLAIVYYALPGTVAAYLLWYRGVVFVSAGTAGIFTGAIPISAVLLSFFILGEPLSWSYAIGMLCVLLALFLVTRKPRARNNSYLF